MPEVIMPKMGDAMTEGKVLRWIKQPGDAVAKGEPIAEIETDKVNVDLESEFKGTLAKILVGAGEVAAVGAPIALIAEPGERVEAPEPATAQRASPAAPRESVDSAAAPAGSTGAPSESAPAPPKPAPARPAGAEDAPARAQTKAPAPAVVEREGPIRASPLARKLADQQGVPLEAIRGTGPEGRITKEDVEAVVLARQAAVDVATPAAPAALSGVATPEAPAAAAPAATRDVPLTRMRQTIARRMSESKQAAPHIYITMSARMDAALEVRRQLNERFGDDRKISVNDLVLRAAALALRTFPNLNASYTGESVRRHGDINVAVAIPVADGLLSPVVHRVDRKPLWQIAQETKALIERARGGHLKPDDLTGGTFTVSNLGPFDVDSFVAIINPPQAAILAVAAAKPQPVVRDGRIEVATMMAMTLSADHRVTDGAEASQFLGEIRRLLESPVWLVAEDA